jgi:proteasome lid subunit RPN8/RPN11
MKNEDIDWRLVLERAENSTPKYSNEVVFPKKVELNTIVKPPAGCHTIPSPMKIRRRALGKALAYSRLVREMFGNYECYGFLLEKDGSSSGIAEDCILAPEQQVSYAGVHLSNESVHKSGEELMKTEFRANGWFHGHASFRAYHSPIDDDNIETVLSQSRAYQVYKDKSVKYTYSLVVNNVGSFYGKTAIECACGAVVDKTVPVEILGGGEPLDLEGLRHEVKEKIIPPPPIYFERFYDPFGFGETMFGMAERNIPAITIDKLPRRLLKLRRNVLDAATLILGSISTGSQYGSWENDIISAMVEQKLSLADALKKVGTPFAPPQYKDSKKKES